MSDTTIPAILFPFHGCHAAGTYTSEQLELLYKQMRLSIREHQSNPGVQALIQMLEMNAGRAQSQAMQREANDWDRGCAAGKAEFLAVIQQVLTTVESDA